MIYVGSKTIPYSVRNYNARFGSNKRIPADFTFPDTVVPGTGTCQVPASPVKYQQLLVFGEAWLNVRTALVNNSIQAVITIPYICGIYFALPSEHQYLRR